jgi:hypothetical protein
MRIGTGIAAVIAGSTLLLNPLAAGAKSQPTRVCFDNASAGHCGSLDVLPSGGSGSRVTVRQAPAGRPDAKDHPNYGSVNADVVARPDAKDNPNYGPVTAELAQIYVPSIITGGAEVAARPDAKDHPNYGSASAGSASTRNPTSYSRGVQFAV